MDSDASALGGRLLGRRAVAFAHSCVPGIVADPVHEGLKGLRKNCRTPSLHSLQLKAINTKGLYDDISAQQQQSALCTLCCCPTQDTDVLYSPASIHLTMG